MAKKANGGSKDKAASKTAASKKPAAKPATKTDIVNRLAEKTQLSKKQVSDVLDQLGEVIKQELSKKGPGIFTLPGVLKLKRVEKKATKERKGRNPATGEEITIPAKPKSTDVRARVLKNLKEAVK